MNLRNCWEISYLSILAPSAYSEAITFTKFPIKRMKYFRSIYCNSIYIFSQFNYEADTNLGSAATSREFYSLRCFSAHHYAFKLNFVSFVCTQILTTSYLLTANKNLSHLHFHHRKQKTFTNTAVNQLVIFNNCTEFVSNFISLASMIFVSV